jgi:hypothetical protein
LLSRAGGKKVPSLSWWLLLSPRTALLTAIAGGSENPVGEVAGFLSKAKQQMADDASIENEIRLSTWSLLFAELLAESPDLGLWSGAVDAFVL